MDQSVIRALARWPNVPAVHGWLALDRRGRWRLRGELLDQPRIAAFIGRNYAPDERGRWYFQNGPQRVYVALDYTPWVLFWDGAELATHTGRAVRSLAGAWVDEDGALVLETEHGAGLVAGQDLAALGERIVDDAGRPCEERHLEMLLGGADPALALECAGARVAVRALRAADAPRRFGYDPSPAPDTENSA